jgi:anti-sigma factor RsiW
MQHLEEGTIHAWLDGALDAEEAARVEQHAAECAACASAVAEARGLVAGASRILSALDDAPSAVAPRSATFAQSARAAQRSRSLWHVLHLTPSRAAAAAVLIVAAGTALVMRQGMPKASPTRMLATDTAMIFTPSKMPVSASPLPSTVANADSVAVRGWLLQ